MNEYVVAYRQLRRDLAEMKYESFFREMRQVVEDGVASAQGERGLVSVHPASVTISDSLSSNAAEQAQAVSHTHKGNPLPSPFPYDNSYQE